MLALKPTITPVTAFLVRLATVLALVLPPTFVLAPGVAYAERLYPVALMNWMVEGSFYALIADKSQQRLSVWKIKDGEPALVESYRCSTGENNGDKWVRGDMKTPEGVYFFCSVIDGKTLPQKYGPWAFTTDYPNFVDRRRGKNGDGIWLHGRDKPLSAKPDSNGCIALENQDLMRVSRYIRLQSTPLIVVNELRMAPRSVIMDQERELRSFIESWRQAWESKELDAYMLHYSPNFQSYCLDHRGWKEKKRKLSERYRDIRVKLGSVYLYRQNGIITSIFTQSYLSDGYQSTGIKVLYIEHENRLSIYAEDYHHPIDDPFPVGTLLVKNGMDPGSDISERKDSRIRLVSTDEPEGAADELEAPRRSAPSRGVVLEKVVAAKDAPIPAYESNDRCRADESNRLVIACLDAAETPGESLALQGSSGRIREAKTSEPDGTKGAYDRAATQGSEAGPRASMMISAMNQPLASKLKTDKKISNKRTDEPNSESDNSNTFSADNKNVLDFLAKWKAAWEQKDLDRFVKMYNPDFGYGSADFKAFVKSKKNFFRKYRTIRVSIERVEIRKTDDRVEVNFVQAFQGDDYSDKGRKTMVLAGSKNKGFRIIEERWSPL